ncbi:MAG: type III-A CRISPR-associated RAMP protein Csm4 [Bacteroidaceae bacterium]|nr:type III-A CRISPR-associated RAMP protein Csm4 [Bacteroidaceae bacterium]
MEYTIIKLTEMSPLHVGTGRDSLDFSSSELQSDTLSAALASMRARQGKDSDIADFLSSFVLSSAFPFWKNNYYLPKPQGRINVTVSGKEEHEYRKKLKKVQYVELSLWKNLINGETCSISDEQIHGSFLSSAKKIPELYKSAVQERVAVSRNGKDAKPFFFDWKYFDKDAGLFCFTDATGQLLDEVVALFKLLGEEGIGTDRNCGGGKFNVVTDTINIESVADSNSQMLLSMYIPTEEEVMLLNLDESKYDLKLRGGFIAGSSYEEFRHLRKKSVFMFNAGSVFSTQSPLKGKVVDLRPQWNDTKLHPVFRSGRPLYVSIKTIEQ